MNAREEDWKELNLQGLIPGPEETEEEFIQRAEFCRNLLRELRERVNHELPFDLEDTASKNITQDAFHFSEKLFGIAPVWVPIFFNNYRLSKWHGGCAWIFQLEEQTPTSAFLQLRKNFKNKSWYMGIYNRKELIAHELAHVGRMVYQEPDFEEILAYRSSDSKFRRFFGPLIQSSKESLFFIILLGLVFLTDLALLSVHTPLATTIAWWLLILPFFFVILALLRLFKRQFQFNRCLKNLRKVYLKSRMAKHLIYRLTDKEICLFGKMKPTEISAYIQSHSLLFFRWAFLTKNYPPPI